MRSDLTGPLRVASVYILFSSAWILGSDYLLNALGADAKQVSDLQTVKGLLFILLSSLLILFLSHRDRRAQRRLLDELSHNTRLLQQTQHTAGLGYWQYDGRFHWSAEALLLLARAPDDEFSTQEQLLAWLHPADRAPVQRALLALFEQHTPLQISARLHQPQKPQCSWLMLRAEADDDGQTLGTVQDISNQKRDEAALRESEQRFRQLFERTPRIAVQGYDRERRVIYWNQASSQLYGFSMQDAMGKRLEELIVPPAGRGQVIAAINSWLLGGPAIQAAEMQLQRKDGKPVWVFSSHSMLRNTRDQVELYCIDIDLSEQKRVYADLYASEERFRDMVEQLSDVIVLADARGQLTFYNPAWEQLSGYLSDESLGRPLPHFLVDEDGERLAAQIKTLVSRPLKNVDEAGKTRQKQARKRSLRAVNEHSEPVFNAVLPTQVVFQQPDSGQYSSLRGEYRLLTRQGQIRRIELQLTHSRVDNSLRGSLRDIHEEFQQQELQGARNAVLDELLARRPLTQILDDISRRLQGLNPHMLVSIMLLDGQRHLQLTSAPSLPDDYRRAIDGIPAALELGSCGHAACSGELVIAENLSEHPYWRDHRELTRAAGLHACWSLPFKDDHGRVLGTFGIYYAQPTRPSAADIALVTEFTRLASLAVQQQRNY